MNVVIGTVSDVEVDGMLKEVTTGGVVSLYVPSEYLNFLVSEYAVPTIIRLRITTKVR